MNRKVCVLSVLLLLLVFTVSSIFVRGASQVELTPVSGEPGDSVMVEGTDFAASNNTGIGFGPPVTVTDEVHNATGEGTGPYVARTNHYPLQPGSLNMHCEVEGGQPSDWTDLGNGTLGTDFAYSAGAYVNYVIGEFGRSSTMDLTGLAIVFTVSYAYYQFNVTPAAGVPTDVSGAFTVNITVPDIWNGTEPVTVVDPAGNMAWSDFTVEGSDIIPEPLTIGAIVLLSSAALVVSFYWLRKKHTNKMLKYS